MKTETDPIQPPLKVYKASAGSGKTFTLAVEYIKLLIANPLSYRNILAVTFTNKATEEMKSRIISQLNGLANGYNDSKNYMRKITDELGIDESVVRRQAKTALRHLTHDYNAFRVETIDKFFQRVLKNLARELDLTPNLRIELNDQQVEQMAVDAMIETLGDNDKVLSWVMGFILEKIRDDKSWDVIKLIKNFGEQIFKDAYKMERDKLMPILADPHFFDNYKKELKDIATRNLQTMADIADAFFEATAGYTMEDFAYKDKGIYSYFCHLKAGDFTGGEASARVRECMEEPSKWAKKGAANRQDIISLAEEQLIPLLCEAEARRQDCYHQAQSAQLTLKHLNELRLLGEIEAMVRLMNNDANRFLLSDTQGMLNKMIEESDSPFIFERIGAPLRHIMIDEFQDTSSLQWENFKVLLNDCMSKSTGNLIVGDVKQSIYRWRAGDWRLLNDITHQFADERLLEVKTLDTNHRSSRRVIEFNNHFFEAAADAEYERLRGILGESASQLQKAYSDVCQQIPPQRGDDGYVHVELMTAQEHQENIMQHIADTIHSLTENGVPQRQIAILARRNQEIADTAAYFQVNVPDISIVSDEAYSLGSSLAVNIIITALRVMVNEKDLLSKAYLAKMWNMDILHHQLNDDDILLATDLENTAKAFSEWMPKGFATPQAISQLRTMPLTDLVENIYAMFGLDKAEGQSPYVSTFYDIIAEHLKDNSSDIERFLQAWDEKYRDEKIHGDDVEGVRIVSIHKSKGLEFDNVIVPFCNWALEGKANTIWCKTDEHPYDKLPLLPIDYSRTAMVNTAYEDSCLEEHLQNSVDNLNLLYVAFTRAKTRLYVFGVVKDPDKKTKKASEGAGNRSLLIEKSIGMLASASGESSRYRLEGCQLHTGENGSLILDYGYPPGQEPSLEEKEEEETKNVLLMSDESETFTMRSYPNIARFRQSNSSHAFTTTDPQELLRSAYIERGNLLHEFFSRLRDINDIERVLTEMTHEGILYDEVSPEEMSSLLTKALSNKQVREWFDPKWTLHNECQIITFEEGHIKTLRPDRVMSDGTRTVVIDFKFGKYDPEHKKQVKRYIKLLTDMGYRQIEGYLWYVSINKTITV